MAKRVLHLVRHGQYNLKLREQGELTGRGREQAHRAAAVLAQTPLDRMVYSPVPRAVQTAQLIGTGLNGVPMQQDDILRECLPPMTPRVMEVLALGHMASSPQEMARCAERLDDVFQRYVVAPNGEDQADLLVCHGNVIRYLVARALDIDLATWTRLLIHNCSITRLVINAGGEVFLMAYNDIGHLPGELLTEN